MCVRPILLQAHEDLANVETSGVLGAANGWWFHPVKGSVLLPVLEAADTVLQPVADVHEGTEFVVEVTLETLFGAFRRIHHVASTAEAVLASVITEKADMDVEPEEDPYEREERLKLYGEVEENPFFSIAKFLEWKTAIEKLVKFLKNNNIVDEMTSIQDENLLSNTTVLQRVQDTWDFREAAASRNALVRPIPGKATASKYMKFATAAYGITMMYLPGVARALEGPMSHILSLLEALAKSSRETLGAIISWFPETIRALLGIEKRIAPRPSRMSAVTDLVPSYMTEYLQAELQNANYGPTGGGANGLLPPVDDFAEELQTVNYGFAGGAANFATRIEEPGFLWKMIDAAISLVDAVVAFQVSLVRKAIAILTFPIVCPIKYVLRMVVQVAERIAVSYYIDIPMKDFVKFNVSPGGSMKVLRHYVVIDRTEKAIVLVVRGTLSISGLVTDLTANAGKLLIVDKVVIVRTIRDDSQHILLLLMHSLIIQSGFLRWPSSRWDSGNDQRLVSRS